MPREIDLARPLGECDEHDLLIRLGQVWGERDTKSMTRSLATEAHHQILYAIGDLKHIEVRMAADMVRGRPVEWLPVMENCLQAIGNLSSIVILARTGRGGASYLHDRNDGS